ncbi:MAG: M23 family metallopeptidase [Bacteroidia bacterium]|nr:M23 family metallopeptidase [Bacteroidia bacterium]
MSRRRYKFLPHKLQFREISSWRLSQIGRGVLLGAFIVMTALSIAYFLLHWWPTPALQKAQQENTALHQRLEILSKQRDTLYQLIYSLATTESHMYQSLVPQTDSSLGEAATPPLPAVALSEDTLENYLQRMEKVLDKLIKSEPLLYSAELRSSQLPRALPCASVTLGAGYGPVIHPILGSPYPHQGVDFLVPEGEAVLATADGLITRIEPLAGSDASTIYIQHTSSLSTAYFPVRPKVQVGQWVSTGTPIGTVGRILFSRVPFLHYEVWHRGERVDPLLYLWGHFSLEERQQWQAAFARQLHALH